MRIYDRIQLEELSGDQYDLAECIGIEAYRRLVEFYGGTNIYILKADTVLKTDRDDKILADFNGYNHKYLALKYGLTERTIRLIVAPEAQRIRAEPLPEQVTFDEVK